MKRYCLFLFCLLALNVSFAKVRALYPFETQAQTEQFQRLTKNFRCLVCQNQNLAESDAVLARDLRAQIYAQVKVGQSDKAITDYLTARYGNFVRYHPPVNRQTILLWLSPILSLLLGILLLCSQLRKSTH